MREICHGGIGSESRNWIWRTARVCVWVGGWGHRIDSLKMDGCNSIHTHAILDPAYTFMGEAMNKVTETQSPPRLFFVTSKTCCCFDRRGQCGLVVHGLTARCRPQTGRPMMYSCSWPDYIRCAPKTLPTPAIVLLLLRLTSGPGAACHSSIAPPGNHTVDYANTAKHCNIWRMYDDIQDSFTSMVGIVDW